MAKQNGFTLIELMIVVAIIGILSAIAIPAYQDYTTRSKIVEAIAFASACKANVTEYYATSGVLPADNTEANCVNVTTAIVSSLLVTNGTIAVTLGSNLHGASGTVFALVPTTPTADRIVWVCNTATTTVPGRYLPTSCR